MLCIFELFVLQTALWRAVIFSYDAVQAPCYICLYCRRCEGFDIVPELCFGGRDHQREPRGQHGGQESLQGPQLAQGPVRLQFTS